MTSLIKSEQKKERLLIAENLRQFGIEKDDLDISVSDNLLTIKGETKHEEKEEKGEYYRCEISRGTFSRTVALPSDVDSEGGKAKFKDGVLELTLPKIEKTKRRSIKIE